MKPDLVRHLSGESLGSFPVWMMRQAGRFLPSYRKIRESNTFWDMVTQPELAAKVTLLPMDEFPVDAAIFFSDILTLPRSIGIGIEMSEGVGPIVSRPLTRVEDYRLFDEFDPLEHTPFVGQALTEVRKRLSQEKALIGFAGGPWTVASYLIEGKISKGFQKIKTWLYQDPSQLTDIMGKLQLATVKYLRYQVKMGADLLQIFDTWAGEIPRSYFLSEYLPLLNSAICDLKQERVPIIYFAKGVHHLLKDFESLEADIVGVDSLITLSRAQELTLNRFSLQGNLDPTLLFCDPGTIRKATRRLVAEARLLSRPPILNLGHGVLPGTPVDHAKIFVEESKALWI